MKNNISKRENEINYCTSCQLCSAVCPVDAIEIKLDIEGFYKPFIYDKKCIDCGKCVSVCHKYDNSIAMSDEYKKVYAAKSKDKNILLNSTSGGIGTHLAEQLIKEGYKIVGVTYNYKSDTAENIIIEKTEDLYKIQGSKYIQSYSEKSYKEILKNLKDEKYAVFGLPCQIYGIDKYLKKINKRENFVLIDLFCHGCPSLNLWTKYLNFTKQKYNLLEIEKVEFRSKKKGWHEFIISILDKKGQKFISKNEQDGFFRLFFSNKVLNKSCYECKLRSTLNYSDIRLGDYWGAEYDLDTEGVSAVVLVTEKGKEIFEKLKNEIKVKESDLNDVIKAQSYGKNYKLNEEERENILKNLDKNKNFKIFLKEYEKTLSKKEKIKYILKNIFYLLPQRMRFRVKRYYHGRK